jgi:hypothetical protein
MIILVELEKMRENKEWTKSDMGPSTTLVVEIGVNAQKEESHRDDSGSM